MRLIYYNLNTFGAEVREMRNSFNATQRHVCKEADIHEDTLRKIENGRVMPNQVTLDLLSAMLKIDLNYLLLNHRLKNYPVIKKLYKKIESILDEGNYKSLSNEINYFKRLVSKEANTYYVNEMHQFILLLEAIYLANEEQSYEDALLKLIEAIKITTRDFSLEQYPNFVYSDLELRILMNIASIIGASESLKTELEILNFCLKKIKSSHELYPKLCYNLSYLFHKLDNHKKAFEYSSKGINSCINQRNHNGLNLLYFRKGIASYYLQQYDYLTFLKTAIYLCEALQQKDLKNLFITNCHKLYKIDPFE